MSAPSNHLSVDELADYLEALPGAGEAYRANAHLASCPRCQATRQQLLDVRALLVAEGATPLPMPAHVSAALDHGLAAEATRAPAAPPPAQGARWPRLLVAAAGVAVLGGAVTYGVQRVSDDPGQSSAATSSSQALTEGGAAGRANAAPKPPAKHTGGQAATAHPPVLRLSSSRFAADLAKELPPAVPSARDTTPPNPARPRAGEVACVARVLPGSAVTQSQLYPATLDGRRVTIVVRLEQGVRNVLAVDCAGSPQVLLKSKLR